MLGLVLSGGYHLLNPKVEGIVPENDAYESTVLRRMHRFFGPFPRSYSDFRDQDTMIIINYIQRPGPTSEAVCQAGPREIPLGR
jgi:hypothetical protein